jgi:putative DNA primase/helicase
MQTKLAKPAAILNLKQHPDREMRIRRQWVCWRYELVNGNWKKPPYNPLTGQKVDTTQRQPLATYKEAALAARAGRFDGIGYVFYPEERFIRIDLDHCRDPHTGQIDKWAQEIAAFLKTYGEVSPSGEGLHFIAKGRLHGRNRRVTKLGKHRRGELEMYSQGQGYFTWTNERIDDSPVRECSEECTTLYEIAFWEQLSAEKVREHLGGVAPVALSIEIQTRPRTAGEEKADNWLLNRARCARNGKAFSRLYDELPQGSGSQHEDDFRLCLMLLYWTQDERGIPNLSWADRLFRHSTRFKGGRWEKWDRRLGQFTYGQVTLWKAYLQRHIQFGPGRSAATVVADHRNQMKAQNELNHD